MLIKRFRAMLAAMLLALIVSPAVANEVPFASGYKTPPDGELMPRMLHNAPIAFTTHSETRTIKMPFGGRNDSITGTLPEYFWITNAGDPKTKPDQAVAIAYAQQRRNVAKKAAHAKDCDQIAALRDAIGNLINALQ